ncbi:NAD(P)/FAD-dependent oxidoreductase [Nocardia farcinica]
MASGAGAGARAVVLGGGFAGILAAGALAPHVGAVTVLDRDDLPHTPAHRRGLPQDRHPHFLGPGGADLVEHLLPGALAALWGAGARRIRTNEDLLLYCSAGGWLPRYRTDRAGVACSRALLDHVLRERVTAAGGVEFRTRCEPVGLLGDAAAVTGVRYRDHDGGTHWLTADLVVDATGRASRAPGWLAALGVPGPRTQVVDAGHAYATRVFRARPGTEVTAPLVLIQAETGAGRPSGNAALVPIEDGQWLVTVGGMRGTRAPADGAEFLDYARHGVGTPLLADLLADAEPLTGILRSHSTCNRRHRFDRVRRWPRGFVAVGDAATALNPVYGQGLTVAARCARALRTWIGDDAVDTRRLQRAVGRAGVLPWEVATRQDRRFPNTVGPALRAHDRLAHRYADRVMRTAQHRPAVGARLIDAMFLAAPALTRLGDPRVLAAAARRVPGPLSAPPLTERERALLTGGRL